MRARRSFESREVEDMDESIKQPDVDLKLKAKMTGSDDLNYIITVAPVNFDWKYNETDLEYRIHESRFKNDAIRQIIRNILFKYKEILISSVKVGSKDFLFEFQVPKQMNTEKLKEIFTQISDELKKEITKSRTELDSFKQFLDNTEF